VDIFVLKALIDDLQSQVSGALVSKIFQINRDDVLLRLWRGRDVRLLLSTQARAPRLHLTTCRFENPPRPPRFAALLRARLRRARLQALSVLPYDRVVRFSWARPGEDASELTLIHELAGRRANIILVDRQDMILDALKYVSPEASNRRTIQPGHGYRPPTCPPQRVRVDALCREHLVQLQRQGSFSAAHLQRLLVGVSPVLLRELVHRSQGDPQVCWELMQQLRQQYDHAALKLWRCTMADGTQHLSVLPLTSEAAEVEACARPQEAVAAFYESAMQDEAVATMRRDVQKTVSRRLQKFHRKLANLRRDHERLQNYLPYQRYGTLLVAQRGVPRGAESVAVVDYYDPEQPTIQIALDPTLSVQANAQAYFKKYRKAKQGMVKVEALLEQCAQATAALETYASRLVQAEDRTTLQALADQLGDTSSTDRRQQRRKAAPPVSPTKPYRCFVSSDGYTLYCGKSKQGNDLLLRHIARPEDIWLHAHQQAGAHVIIKTRPDHEVPHRTLLEAAAVAAFYSQGKHAAAVEVLYTRVQDVHKFRGARPGQVAVNTYRTLEVAPRLPDS
jgi:predicted ribosome quality control (RQC) complex YloA/Tae2 family protein